MKKNGIIEGKWEVKNNKNIKVYNITEKGLLSLKTLKEKIKIKLNDDEWKEFIGDIID